MQGLRGPILPTKSEVLGVHARFDASPFLAATYESSSSGSAKPTGHPCNIVRRDANSSSQPLCGLLPRGGMSSPPPSPRQGPWRCRFASSQAAQRLVTASPSSGKGADAEAEEGTPVGAESTARIYNNTRGLANLALGEVLPHAIGAGKLLIESRADVEHGTWLAWVRSCWEFSPRTAQNHIRLTRQQEALPPRDAKRVSHLSLRETIQVPSSAPGQDDTEVDGSAVRISSEPDQWNIPQLVFERALSRIDTIARHACPDDAHDLASQLRLQ